MRSFWSIAVLVTICLSSGAAGSWAGEIEDLDREIEVLRERVERLERERAFEEVAEEEMEAIRPRFGLNMGGFGDVNFQTESREKENNTFSIGSFDIYSTASRKGGRLNFLFELLVEEENDGSEVDIERLWVSYVFSDLFTIRAGKMHTAMGYWNKAFHHGKYLFYSVDRPFITAFEDHGGVMPTHIIGLEFTGGVSAFHYWIEVGNGLRITDGELALNNTTDDDGSKQFILRVTSSPALLPGLSLGFSYARYSVDTTVEAGLYEDVYGLDLYYAESGFELLTEHFIFDNSFESAYAFYVQVSYAFDTFTPYARHESMDSDSGDPYLNELDGGSDRAQSIAGLKFDVEPLHSAIKTQYRYDDEKGADVHNVIEVQWSFHF